LDNCVQLLNFNKDKIIHQDIDAEYKKSQVNDINITYLTFLLNCYTSYYNYLLTTIM